MDRPSFEELVAKAIRTLPRKFKQRLENIAIHVESEPSDELLDEMGIDEDGTLYGLYTGVPLTERDWNFGNVLPDRIVIYQHPIEQDAETSEEIEEIVQDTVMHEVGHYFGFTDDELYAMEEELDAYRRKKRSG